MYMKYTMMNGKKASHISYVISGHVKVSLFLFCQFQIRKEKENLMKNVY